MDADIAENNDLNNFLKEQYLEILLMQPDLFDPEFDEGRGMDLEPIDPDL